MSMGGNIGGLEIQRHEKCQMMDAWPSIQGLAPLLRSHDKLSHPSFDIWHCTLELKARAKADAFSSGLYAGLDFTNWRII
jgi:hypothetical protein